MNRNCFNACINGDLGKWTTKDIMMKYRPMALFILLASAILFVSACDQSTQSETMDEPVQGALSTPTIKADKSKIAGNWVRTDAPYQLTISDVSDKGVMKAAYFNPNPINVGKSNWSDANGIISVYVELRDVNYPGSNYKLTYEPGQDILIGKYFQAVEGTTYDISFSRSEKVQ